MFRLVSILLGSVAMAFSGGPAAAAPFFKYVVGDIEVTDLGTLPSGGSSAAYGINDHGDIAGEARDANGKQHAFVYLGGQLLSIHDGTPSWISATAYSINNSKVVVGSFRSPVTNRDHPFYYYPGIWLAPLLVDMPSLGLYHWHGVAHSIEQSGRIVGWLEQDPSGGTCKQIPARWTNNGAYPVQLFCPPDLNGGDPNSAAALDVNSSGNIVGFDHGSSPHGMFMMKSGVRIDVPWVAGFTDVNHLDNKPLAGKATGLNNQNRVVGYFMSYVWEAADYWPRGFIWDSLSASATDIGILPGYPWTAPEKINEAAMVVGNAQRSNFVDYDHAGFLWHADFGMKRLPSPWFEGGLQNFHATECWAYAINELKGGVVQAVGKCHKPNVGWRAVRWDIGVSVVPILPPG